MSSRRRVLAAGAAVLGILAASGTAVGSPSAAAADPVTFTVGADQDVDSLNVTVGYLVIEYEIWNLTLPTLTTKAAKDFAVEPGLAESWVSSDNGLTWTYTLREGMKWSDGEPLTADDVAYTINRSVEEEWYNHFTTTANLTATATDARTLVVTSSVPDPKLPTLDVYIVPKHIYEKISAEELPDYQADDYVSGGPFRVAERADGEFVRLERNPNWWGKRPAIDQVVFRSFETSEAQYNALLTGDIDATDNLPAAIYADVVAGKVPNVDAIGGNQGGFTELAMNAGCPSGLGDGHPALTDTRVRQAINWAIDRDLLVDKVLKGNGTAGVGLVPSADPAYDLQIPDADKYRYDPAKARALLDEAGWTDADGNGTREKDGRPLTLRLYDRSQGDGQMNTPFITEWLKDIGVGVEITTYDNDTLTSQIAAGTFDLFIWGWVPFVDPDPQLADFITDQVTTDPEAPGANDANWCNTDYDALYKEQNQQLDKDKRAATIQQMLRLFYDEAPYAVLYKYDELQAIRSDRWTDFVRQPEGTGPVLFTNTSPSYLFLTPKGAEGGSSRVLFAGIVAAAAAVVVAVPMIVRARRRRSTADERE